MSESNSDLYDRRRIHGAKIDEQERLAIKKAMREIQEELGANHEMTAKNITAGLEKRGISFNKAYSHFGDMKNLRALARPEGAPETAAERPHSITEIENFIADFFRQNKRVPKPDDVVNGLKIKKYQLQTVLSKQGISWNGLLRQLGLRKLRGE